MRFILLGGFFLSLSWCLEVEETIIKVNQDLTDPTSSTVPFTYPFSYTFTDNSAYWIIMDHSCNSHYENLTLTNIRLKIRAKVDPGLGFAIFLPLDHKIFDKDVAGVFGNGNGTITGNSVYIGNSTHPLILNEKATQSLPNSQRWNTAGEFKPTFDFLHKVVEVIGPFSDYHHCQGNWFQNDLTANRLLAEYILYEMAVIYDFEDPVIEIQRQALNNYEMNFPVEEGKEYEFSTETEGVDLTVSKTGQAKIKLDDSIFDFDSDSPSKDFEVVILWK